MFGQLNINSLRNKFDNELIKGYVDVFNIFETKVDDSFTQVDGFIDGYHASFRPHRKGNSAAICLYVRKDILAKVFHCDFPAAESFYVEINLYRKALAHKLFL